MTPGPVPLVVLRHGPTDWNAGRRIQGLSDRPLSAAGRAVVRRWKLPDDSAGYHWMTSPLLRARETAALMGHGDAVIESALVETYGRSLKSDILVVPHQGSKTSSTSSFLNAVAPQLGVISNGYRNRFKHPHASVLARYESHSIPLLRTDLAGAITVDFASSPGVKSERNTRTGYWYNKDSHAY